MTEGREEGIERQERKERKERNKKVNSQGKILSGGWRSKKNLGGNILLTYPRSLE
jgi:hypothetical protein